MKYLYKRPDNSVAIIVGAPKASLEKELGPLTDEQYAEVIKRSAPPEAEGRFITEADYPPSLREFRDAWCDVAPGTQIDIDAAKAKDIQLEHLRKERDALLAETDVAMTRALEGGDEKEIAEIKATRQALRDATEALKALTVTGIADDAMLNEIRVKGAINRHRGE
jgi:hypothetical protein